jgi:predicted secreted protein
MAAKLGLNGKVYRLTTGSRASWGTVTAGVATAAAPSNLDEITAVRDLTLNLEKGEADVTTRGNSGWRALLGTLKDASLEFDTVWDGADADQVALLASFNVGSVIAIAVLDGDKATSGTQGFWADFEVMGVAKGEELEEGQKVTWTIKPALTSVAPQWVKVS